MLVDVNNILTLAFVEHQQTIHLKCFGVKPGMAEGHWSGLEFFNSTTKKILPEDAIQVNSSASIMKFVDIEYAGVTPFGEPISALRADPYAPLMYNVHISNSALDGTNFTNLKSWTIIEDSYIHDNRGMYLCNTRFLKLHMYMRYYVMNHSTVPSIELRSCITFNKDN